MVHSEGDFQAFAIVCLAAIVMRSRSWNWRCVIASGLLFGSATDGSGVTVVLNMVERRLNTSDQKVRAIGQSHPLYVGVFLGRYNLGSNERGIEGGISIFWWELDTIW